MPAGPQRWSRWTGPRGSRCRGAGLWQRPSHGHPHPRGGRGHTESDTCKGTMRRSLEGLAASPGVSRSWDRHTERVSPKAYSRPHPHSRLPGADRINPRPGLTLRRGPGLQGEAWPAKTPEATHQTRPGPRAGVRLPREASASSPWPSRPLHTQETSGTSVACSDPLKEKLRGQLGQH